MEELTTTSSREDLAGGLIGLLKPAVEELDQRVLAVRYARVLMSAAYCGGTADRHDYIKLWHYNIQVSKRVRLYPEITLK